MTAAWIDYDEHARTRKRDDFWGQVRRTVRGRPVPDEQIETIVATIQERLQLGPDDTLLDIACGNGALTGRLHPHCRASLGIDVSDYLIGIAHQYFSAPDHEFLVGDAAAAAELEPDPARFTKALCYGSLSYLDDLSVARLLRALRRRFDRLGRVFLGNLPDPAHAAAFYDAAAIPDLRQPRSDIGVWRTAGEIASLAGPGWRVTPSTMPPGFFAAHYRFDLLLERIA